ncbi:MAG: 50S ribosomal protein L6 [Kiritimatiellia bacterium]|nr:50S ribosomal protein L6 [Kiritimatiellia bacterium]
MSRIGKQPVKLPAGVVATVEGNTLTVKGPKGELQRTFEQGISLAVEGDSIVVTRADDSRRLRGFHGLTRTLAHNMVVGVTQGYKKELTIEGTGFKAQIQGNKLLLSLGFASPKEYLIPEGITITEKQGTALTVEGMSKELVGTAAARIRSYYPAEPYKGKGIKYLGEQIRRKEGKTVA